MMKKINNIALLFGLFVFACGSNKNTTPQTDTAGQADTCTCSTDQECQAKAKQCMQGVCRCTCQFSPLPQGVSCDDQNPNTDPDTCDGNGQCVGAPVKCGDKKCTGDENCLSCPQDCGCKEGFRCVDGECEKLPKCQDGECESGENCASCPQDCPCGPGTVCFAGTGECLNCKDYCSKAGKECGVDQNGCDCGTCEAGKSCNALGKCEDSTLCGNGTCEVTENCASCPQDCGCPSGEACVDKKCQSCTTVCENNNRECGSIYGCDCGKCSVCHRCSQGKCKGNKTCLCYHKECGQVEGFDCGQCDPGQDCVFYKCVAGCDALCKNKECGWSGPGEDACFCGFCDGCTQCDPTQNKCVAADQDDTNEPNNIPDQATEITGTTGSVTTSLYPSEDDDWYKLAIESNSKSLMFTLTGLAPDKDYDLVVCLKCKDGDTQATSLLGEKDGVYKIDPLVAGAVCYASINLAGFDEKLRVLPKCESGGSTYYVGVLWGTDETDCGSSYKLEWKH